MTLRQVIITIDDSTGLTGRDIGKMIERCTVHAEGARLEITSTPDTIDIRFEKEYSEIAITGPLYERLAKAAADNHVTINQILEGGAKRYGV